MDDKKSQSKDEGSLAHPGGRQMQKKKPGNGSGDPSSKTTSQQLFLVADGSAYRSLKKVKISGKSFRRTNVFKQEKKLERFKTTKILKFLKAALKTDLRAERS